MGHGTSTMQKFELPNLENPPETSSNLASNGRG